jgi:hypothetical protein
MMREAVCLHRHNGNGGVTTLIPALLPWREKGF